MEDGAATSRPRVRLALHLLAGYATGSASCWRTQRRKAFLPFLFPYFVLNAAGSALRSARQVFAAWRTCAATQRRKACLPFLFAYFVLNAAGSALRSDLHAATAGWIAA